jgi:hypothetical protein
MNFKVGNPSMLNYVARSFSTVASIFASVIPKGAKNAAAYEYSGASFLQCPHHGA